MPKKREAERLSKQKRRKKLQKRTIRSKQTIKKKKTMVHWLIYGLYVIGFLVVTYPFVSNYYYSQLQKNVTDDYYKQVVSKDEKELAKLKENMEEYNQRLADTKAQQIDMPEFSGDRTHVTQREKEQLGETIAVIEIPKINVKLPVYKGTSDVQLKNGAGLLEGTSLPFGGKSSHSVITGHRGLPTAKLFTDLPKLEVKDHFYLNVLQETHAYEVDQLKVVEPEDVEELLVTQNEDYITLLTCTPYMVNTHRLLVRGHRIPYDKEQHQQDKKEQQDQQIQWLILGLLLALLLSLLLLWLKRRRKKKHRGKRKNKRIISE